jgi:hypothetical protein
MSIIMELMRKKRPKTPATYNSARFIQGNVLPGNYRNIRQLKKEKRIEQIQAEKKRCSPGARSTAEKRGSTRKRNSLKRGIYWLD